MSRALWHQSREKSVLLPIEPSLPEVGELQIKSLFSLVSTGTERLVARGEIPEKTWDVMKVPYMQGGFGFPVKYGYSLVGEVISAGSYSGKMVHLLHPHQESITVDQNAVFEIPSNVPAKRATLASNLETAVNAVWDAGITVGDKVLVAGFGMIGSLVARLVSMIPAVELQVLEKDEEKRLLGESLGFKMVDKTGSGYFDVAINTTANGEALQNCIESVGLEGRIVELSWYGIKGVNLHLGADFHYQRKRIISSQVSKIPGERSSRWDYYRRKQVVFELLQSDVFDAHITKVIPFDQAPDFFNDLRQNRFDGLGCCIRY